MTSDRRPPMSRTDQREEVKKHKAEVSQAFKRMSFHDDNLISVRISPSRKRVNRTGIEFQFEDDSSKKMKTLVFLECANIRYLMDFDVMTDNGFAQTNYVSVRTEIDPIRRFVLKQMSVWHVRYLPKKRKYTPVREKLRQIREYILFRIEFFGGVAEVLAKDYRFVRHKA